MHPVSSACRDTLEYILRICHRLAMSTDVAVEWRRHRSRFASHWRTSMYARKKVVFVSVERASGLARDVERWAERDAARQPLIKDVPLVQAAAASDRVIISMDEAARTLLRMAAMEIAGLRRILWTNPTLPADDILRWLRAGAPDEDHLLLR